MAYQLDLGALYEQAFGQPTDAFNPKYTAINGDTSLSRVNTGIVASSPYYAVDVNGREYFMPVTFTYPDPTPVSAQDEGLIGSSSTGVLKTWNLPYPVITLKGDKTIIKTPLTERAGTAKELINDKDWEITIRGFLVGVGNNFPEADFTTLCRLKEQNVAIQIACPMTDVILLRPGRSGSDYVVIETLEFPELKGIKHVKPYEMKLVSDSIFNLIDVS